MVHVGSWMKVASIASFTEKHTLSIPKKQSFKPYLDHFNAFRATLFLLARHSLAPCGT
jgi:hypothetical protein